MEAVLAEYILGNAHKSYPLGTKELNLFSNTACLGLKSDVCCLNFINS